jgi:hypothetical protein
MKFQTNKSISSCPIFFGFKYVSAMKISTTLVQSDLKKYLQFLLFIFFLCSFQQVCTTIVMLQISFISFLSLFKNDVAIKITTKLMLIIIEF